MRIAYLGIKGLPSKGGAERVVEAIVQRLAGQHELTVYCNSRYTPPDAKVSGLRLIRIPTLPGKHLQPILYFVFSALHALFKGDYDLVHVHNVEACFVLPLLRLRYNVIATAHGSPIRAARAKWGPVARALMGLTELPYLFLSNCVTSVSLADADYFEHRYGRNVVYLPNGIKELPVMSQEMALRVLRGIGVEAGRYILFAAGRIDPTKGCHLLLEAFRRLDLDMPLVVVGDLAQVPEYSQRLRRLADDRVIFIGYIAAKEKLFSIVRNCRLFVFPSIVEAMSMMLLEVVSLRVPLICSDIPENMSVVDRYALYFRSEDSKDLAEKMRWAIEHPDVMNNYTAEAEAWVKRNYSWDRIAESYEALYEECRKHPHRRRQ